VRRDARNLMVPTVTTEAEVFFQTGSYAAGMATLQQCRSRWDINLVLLDRKAAPRAATTTP